MAVKDDDEESLGESRREFTVPHRCGWREGGGECPESPFFVILAPRYYRGTVHYRVCNIAALSLVSPATISSRYEFPTLGHSVPVSSLCHISSQQVAPIYPSRPPFQLHSLINFTDRDSKEPQNFFAVQ